MLPRLNSRLRARLECHGASLTLLRGWRDPEAVQEHSFACVGPAADLGDVIETLGALPPTSAGTALDDWAVLRCHGRGHVARV